MNNSHIGCWLLQYGAYCSYESPTGRALLPHEPLYGHWYPICRNHHTQVPLHLASLGGHVKKDSLQIVRLFRQSEIQLYVP